MVDNGIWVYDIETLADCFTYTALNIDTQEVFQSVIWREINELEKLTAHLTSCRGLIGFNNLSFDYPVIHHILEKKEQWKYGYCTGDEITEEIYEKAQEVIGDEWSSVSDKFVKVPQLDLFRIWHYNNKARMTSLKKLEIAMRYENVQDMPYSHDSIIDSIEQVREILDYNLNDVKATYDFYNKTREKLDLRRGLYQKYGLRCMNFPDSKIGEELTLLLYCNKTGEDINEVRKRRTYRNVFKFKECFPKYLDFKTPEFNALVDYLKEIEVTELKGSFKYNIDVGGVVYDIGTGGLHGCNKAGVYKSDDDYIIVDVDVGSMYPNLMIINELYPEHLGKVFLDVYNNEMLKVRLEAKKNGDKVTDLGLKLSLNATYGKTNSEYSWLYDPLVTLKVTLSGQLSLLMLIENMLFIENLVVIQANTK